MSNQFNSDINSDINAAQSNVQSPVQPSVKDETSLNVEELNDEDLEAVAGGAVVLGTGGIEVSLTPYMRRSDLI
jgi:hypothetical protein